MKTTNLIRWSGLICVLAGVLYAVGAFLHPIGETLDAVKHTNWVPSHQVYWVSVLLFHLGLVGLYARLKETAGLLGLVAFILGFIGTSVVSSILLLATTILPIIASDAPTIFEQSMMFPAFVAVVFIMSFGLGWMLIGLVIMRDKHLPRWSGLLLIVGVGLFISSEALPFGPTLAHTLVTIGDILFGLGLVWLGYTLWSEKRETLGYDRSTASMSTS